MIVQKSYRNEMPTLYVIPTPIGNLQDITIRSLETLKSLNYLFCEDTRVTKKLLNFYDIKCTLNSYHTHNEKMQSQEIVKLLSNNNDVGLVSDAGMPLICDPGFEIVNVVRSLGYNVIVLPGSSAFIVNAVASGFIDSKFLFYGFLNKKESKKQKELTDLLAQNIPIIIYETPHKLLKTLDILSTLAPLNEIFITREISKIYEEHLKGSADELLLHFSENIPKGEFVLCINSLDKQEETINNPLELYHSLIAQGITKKDAIKTIAKKMNVTKNEIYQLVLKSEDDE